MPSRTITPDETTDECSNNAPNPVNICEILHAEPLNESPIDVNINRVIPVNVGPRLAWVNFDSVPRKMKITNTGHSVIVSGKWGKERPYITDGVLAGKYVFSHIHFHWGANDTEGSEHTIDGRQFPGELHVVLFKSCYLTQEAALKERDGVAILVYFLDLQESPNPRAECIVSTLAAISKAHTSAKLPPVALNSIFDQFETDYFIYKGSLATTNCTHSITWFITRFPICLSSEQMNSFRFMLDNDDQIIRRNFRTIQPIKDGHVFEILPSNSNGATPITTPAVQMEDKIVQLYEVKLLFGRHLDSIQNDDDVEVKRTRHLLPLDRINLGRCYPCIEHFMKLSLGEFFTLSVKNVLCRLMQKATPLCERNI
ncbi:carbonic anhydrase 2-like isoform X2 [Euwallacea fornicatus]|uniref:carbonic anhydrase 2-like isoform X2 n=1 Tax=Euwallacea fornicatus TaxID=995702 RepID=UPI00338FA7E6